MTVIKIEGLANGMPSAFDGQYLVEYDPCRDGVEPGTGRPMACHLVTTADKDKALQLPIGDALKLWKKVDARDPHGGRYEPDGKLNRPLTAFTVTFE
jgi:hypothetical protein